MLLSLIIIPCPDPATIAFNATNITAGEGETAIQVCISLVFSYMGELGSPVTINLTSSILNSGKENKFVAL